MKLSFDFSRQDYRYLPNWGTTPMVPRFVIVGLGGTGGYVFYYLSRLIAAKGGCQILLADQDIVEEKNIMRQNFCISDIGRSKVEVLSERYGNVYDMNIPYFPHYVEDDAVLYDLLWNTKACFTPTITVLIGCVDNNKTRQLFDRVFKNFNELMVYIDSGNDEWSGQVVMGVRGRDEIILPPISYYYPDILEDNDSLYPSEQSCQATSVSSPQNIATNIMAATIVFSLVNQLFFNGGSKTYGATFNARTGQTRCLWIDDHYTQKKELAYPYVVI